MRKKRMHFWRIFFPYLCHFDFLSSIPCFSLQPLVNLREGLRAVAADPKLSHREGLFSFFENFSTMEGITSFFTPFLLKIHPFLTKFKLHTKIPKSEFRKPKFRKPEFRRRNSDFGIPQPNFRNMSKIRRRLV